MSHDQGVKKWCGFPLYEKSLTQIFLTSLGHMLWRGRSGCWLQIGQMSLTNNRSKIQDFRPITKHLKGIYGTWNQWRKSERNQPARLGNIRTWPILLKISPFIGHAMCKMSLYTYLHITWTLKCVHEPKLLCTHKVHDRLWKGDKTSVYVMLDVFMMT
jgi:hypothetical protein